MNDFALCFRRKQWHFTLMIAIPLVPAVVLIWPTRATRAQDAGKSAPSSWALTTLYTFKGPGDGTATLSGVIHDTSGNLYGTTFEGGDENCGFGGFGGCGTVFMVNPIGMESNLHVFTGSPDGAGSRAPLTHDARGNIYGTTEVGGQSDCGTVFKIAPNGAKTHLYSFTCSQGGGPVAGLVLDPAGNLYGTTIDGNGIAFKLNKQGQFTVLYSFTGGSDGGDPVGGLVRDSGGNLYGTTFNGGLDYSACNGSCGVIFKLDSTGKETTLYSFTGGADGGNPESTLVRDSKANLYGTTAFGGLENSICELGSCGVVFKLDSTGKETTLYSFTGGADGGNPESTLVRDSKANLYGTTAFGGLENSICELGSCGVVFKLRPDGREIILYSFTGQGDGSEPTPGVIADANGNLYGSADHGGKPGCNTGLSCGIVFKVDKSGVETVLYSFTGRGDGSYATGPLLRDSLGNLYGTTVVPSTVFKLSPPQ